MGLIFYLTNEMDINVILPSAGLIYNRNSFNLWEREYISRGEIRHRLKFKICVGTILKGF